jgi:hypothetical protein
MAVVRPGHRPYTAHNPLWAVAQGCRRRRGRGCGGAYGRESCSVSVNLLLINYFPIYLSAILDVMAGRLLLVFLVFATTGLGCLSMGPAHP